MFCTNLFKLSVFLIYRKETAAILDLTKVVTQQILADSHLSEADQSAVDVEAVLSNHVSSDKTQLQPIYPGKVTVWSGAMVWAPNLVACFI